MREHFRVQYFPIFFYFLFSNSTDFLGSCQEHVGVASFQFSLFQALVWNTWGPIESGAQFAFDWDPATVAMFANWGTIMFLVSVLPLSKMIQVRGGERWVPDLQFCDRSTWDTLFSLYLVLWLLGQWLDAEESWQSCFSQKRSTRLFFSSGISIVVCSYHESAIFIRFC